MAPVLGHQQVQRQRERPGPVIERDFHAECLAECIQQLNPLPVRYPLPVQADAVLNIQ